MSELELILLILNIWTLLFAVRIANKVNYLTKIIDVIQSNEIINQKTIRFLIEDTQNLFGRLK